MTRPSLYAAFGDKEAMYATATLHSLAVRARAGASRAALARQAPAAVDLFCDRSP